MIPEMVRHWESGIEIVAGWRANREESWALRTCRRIFYRIVNALTSRSSEGVGEFQLIDRKVWQVVVSHRDHYPYTRGIIASAGFKRLILPTPRARKRGLQEQHAAADRPGDGRHLLVFTSALRFSSFPGFGIALVAVLYALITVLLGLFVPHLAPRGTLTIIAAPSSFPVCSLFSSASWANTLQPIHSQVRGGPIVVERERINIDQSQPNG